MNKIHDIQSLTFNETHLILSVDNQTHYLPLTVISQKLAQANTTERNIYQISPSGYGIHWTLIDEDLSIDGLLKVAKILSTQTTIHNS